jgi:hypothetical protein
VDFADIVVRPGKITMRYGVAGRAPCDFLPDAECVAEILHREFSSEDFRQLGLSGSNPPRGGALGQAERTDCFV